MMNWLEGLGKAAHTHRYNISFVHAVWLCALPKTVAKKLRKIGIKEKQPHRGLFLNINCR